MVTVDGNLCTGCGRCVERCPTDSLALRDGTARPVNGRCIGCGHCRALCPAGAVTVDGLVEPAFETVDFTPAWIPYGRPDGAELLGLLASRRSCRAYRSTPVELATLRDLVTAGTLAPSATNSQCWTFTLLPDRPAVEALVERCATAFERLNRLAARPLVRWGLRLVGRPELDSYYRRYRDFMVRRVAAWRSERRDFVTFGAPAAIVIGSRPGGSHPADDAVLAAQNILLVAHAMGLGTLLVGLAVGSMRHDRSIARGLGCAHDETVHAVIALGYPAVTFERLTGRRKPLVRVADLKPGGRV